MADSESLAKLAVIQRQLDALQRELDAEKRRAEAYRSKTTEQAEKPKPSRKKSW